MRPNPSQPPRVPLSAVLSTVLALVSVNLVLAYVLARAVGSIRDVPAAALWALLAIGVLSALVAVAGWRRYLARAGLDRAKGAPPSG